MKTLWLALSVFAIANLLGIVGFVGWLKVSDRLDTDRLRSMRVMLARTITAEKAEKDVESKAFEAKKKEEEEAIKKGRPPLTASEQLAARQGATEIDEQRINAMRSSIGVLQMPLQAERQALSRERLALDLDKVAFKAIVDAANARTQDQQFKKTVAVMDSLKPADAKAVLTEIMAGLDLDQEARAAERAMDPAMDSAMDSASRAPGGELTANSGAAAPVPAPVSNGRTAKGLDRAMDYLNAMQPRARSKVVTEFAGSDAKLAGELLERLRTHGQVPIGTEKPLRVGSIP